MASSDEAQVLELRADSKIAHHVPTKMDVDAAPVGYTQYRNVDVRELKVSRFEVCIVKIFVLSSVDRLLGTVLGKLFGG